jgi:hypothetical protein
MSAEIATQKAEQEAKVMRLVEFALEHKDDPDFNRLVFPASVLAKLAERGVKVEPKTYSAAAAVDRCFNMSHSEVYTVTGVEVRDQTGLAIEFPPLPESSSPTSTSEPRNLVLMDSSSLPEPDDVSTTVGDVQGPSSECSQEPLPDRTE